MKFELNDFCFFCSKPIEEKRTLEHIIPNKLLKALELKEEFLDGNKSFQYSRIKVPAHRSCNTTFGSRYEAKILRYLENTDSLFSILHKESDEYTERYGPQNSAHFIFSTWLSKLYYGLFYNSYLKDKDTEFNKIAEDIIISDNFKMVQRSYQDGVGFCLPSSLFVFRANDEDFDLRTFIWPQTILLKIKSYIFVLCIADGFLTKAYLNNTLQTSYQNRLLQKQEGVPNFPLSTFVLAEIIALRMNIPKSPSFLYSEKEIINMSFTTLVSNPSEYYKLDKDSILKTRLEILKDLKVKIIE